MSLAFQISDEYETHSPTRLGVIAIVRCQLLVGSTYENTVFIVPTPLEGGGTIYSTGFFLFSQFWTERPNTLSFKDQIHCRPFS